MTTTHEITIKAKCPHGGEDRYAATFSTDRIIPVEVIEKAIEVFTLSPVYQEDLTRMLAECLYCVVSLQGQHGKFLTTSAAGR